jgi:hypothetical protein
MIEFTVEHVVAAPVETVFARLTDHRAYASMTFVRRSTLEREGTPAPNGVGAIRALGVVGPSLRDEITVYEPPHRFGYRVLSGLPVRGAVSDVRLEEAGNATRLLYRVQVTPFPLTRHLVVPVLKAVVGRLVKGIADAAERDA